MNTNLQNFVDLMKKGIEIDKKVIWFDLNTKMLACGKAKNSKTAELYSFVQFTGTTLGENNNLILHFGERELMIEFEREDICAYMEKMFKETFEHYM
jgi:hypothetical protein